MILLLPSIAVLVFYFYFNEHEAITFTLMLSIAFMAAYLSLLYIVPPDGFQFSHSRMGGLYYLLPLASFSAAVFSEDEDIKGAAHWFFLLLGWFGLFVTTACLVFFKFYYWQRY